MGDAEADPEGLVVGEKWNPSEKRGWEGVGLPQKKK